MARPKTPIERKRLHGRGPGRDAAGRPLPEPLTILPAPDEIPPPPPWLKASGVQLWDRVWREARAWTCTLDIGVVERTCQLTDWRDSMIALIGREGFTVSGSNGQPVSHPLIREVHRLDVELRLLEGTLGLSPSARSALGGMEVRRVSKLDEMLAARRARGSA